VLLFLAMVGRGSVLVCVGHAPRVVTGEHES